MPLNPRKGEKKSDFISRCVEKEIKTGKSQKQSLAICFSAWEDKKSKAEFSVQVGEDEIIFNINSRDDEEE